MYVMHSFENKNQQSSRISYLFVAAQKKILDACRIFFENECKMYIHVKWGSQTSLGARTLVIDSRGQNINPHSYPCHTKGSSPPASHSTHFSPPPPSHPPCNIKQTTRMHKTKFDRLAARLSPCTNQRAGQVGIDMCVHKHHGPYFSMREQATSSKSPGQGSMEGWLMPIVQEDFWA